MDKRHNDQLAQAKRELAVLHRRLHAVKTVQMPEPTTQREAEFLAEVARRINEALKA